jgi:hypothetical protein
MVLLLLPKHWTAKAAQVPFVKRRILSNSVISFGQLLQVQRQHQHRHHHHQQQPQCGTSCRDSLESPDK